MKSSALPCPLRACALAVAFFALVSVAPSAWPAAGPIRDANAQTSAPGFAAVPPPPPRAAPAPARPAQPAAAPRQLLISVRYGGASAAAASRSVTASSRDAARDEQHVRVQDGQRALIASRQSSAAAQRYGRASDPAADAGTMIEVQPTLSGNTVLVRLLARRQTASPSGSGSGEGQHVETTLGLPLGEWTEVSGRGPWASSEDHETASSRDARNDARRVFLRVDEIGR